MGWSILVGALLVTAECFPTAGTLLFLKRLTFLKRLARHRSTEQPSFRLINVSEIIFQMLIEELLLNNIKLITFKTPDFGEGEIGLCFL